MIIEFTDKFKNMYSENVPRIKLKTNEEKDLIVGEQESDENLPEDGFIKRFCQEKYIPLCKDEKTNSKN